LHKKLTQGGGVGRKRETGEAPTSGPPEKTKFFVKKKRHKNAGKRAKVGGRNRGKLLAHKFVFTGPSKVGKGGGSQ